MKTNQEIIEAVSKEEEKKIEQFYARAYKNKKAEVKNIKEYFEKTKTRLAEAEKELADLTEVDMKEYYEKNCIDMQGPSFAKGGLVTSRGYALAKERLEAALCIPYVEGQDED